MHKSGMSDLDVRSPKFILDVELDDIPIFIISIDSDLKLPHQSSWSELKILVHTLTDFQTSVR